MTDFSAKDLISYFAARVRRRRHFLPGSTMSVPEYPMAVVYLGNADKAHEELSRHLFRVWPAYEEELLFLSVRPDGEEIAITSLGPDGSRQALTGDDLRRMVTVCFSSEAHFAQKSSLLVYYLLDTTDFKEPSELDNWLRVIKKMKKALAAPQLPVLTMLLQEDFVHQPVAAGIRSRLAELADMLPAVYLISSQLKDGTLLSDWKEGWHIAANLMLLSNQGLPRTVSLRSPGFKAVAYAREEKPVEQIAQAVLRCLIIRLGDELHANALPKPLQEEGAAGRLGLTNEGAFQLLDSYGETLMEKLSADRLSRFPRRRAEEMAVSEQTTGQAFNDLTLGCWKEYLWQMVRETASGMEQWTPGWRRAYRDWLFSQFNTSELAALDGRQELIHSMIVQAPSEPGDLPVLVDGRRWLGKALSAHPVIQNFFLGLIGEMAKEAGAFLSAWQDLVETWQKVIPLADDSISEFYTRKMNHDFDSKGKKWVDELRRIHTQQELEQFLHRIIDELVDGDEIYYAPFEEELAYRLREIHGDDGQAAQIYLRDKLTGDNVRLYLPAAFWMGTPLLSAILLQHDTSLHQFLIGSLPENTWYYQTGSSDRAEAMVIYEVNTENIYQGQEDDDDDLSIL